MCRIAMLGLLLTVGVALPCAQAGPCKLMRHMWQDNAELRGDGALGGFGATTTTYLTLPTMPFCLTEKLVTRNDGTAREFVATNADRIVIDVARGGGEWSASLAALLGCPAPLRARLVATLRAGLPELLPPQPDAPLAYERVLALAEADAPLTQSCIFLAKKNRYPIFYANS